MSMNRTTIYLTSLELKNASDVVHLEGVNSRIQSDIYYRVNGETYHDFRHLQRARYSNQELSEVEPTADYCAQAKEDRCGDLNFLVNEISVQSSLLLSSGVITEHLHASK